MAAMKDSVGLQNVFFLIGQIVMQTFFALVIIK